MKYIAFLAVFITGCSPGPESVQKDKNRYSEMVIDGCQYLVIENSSPILDNYSYSFTHKGNCTNHVHIK